MPGEPARFQRYVALGDSTTEGLMDPDPSGGPRHRGWADRLAEKLARTSPDLLYANLAIRGRKLAQIRAEQLEPALAMEPDLASVLAGVNDVIRPRVDMQARAEDLEVIIAELRSSGATVLLVNYPAIEASVSFASSRLRPRLHGFNVAMRLIAARHGALLVDIESDGIGHPALWWPDRLHASPVGHERMADLAAAALGIGELDPGWEASLPPYTPRSRPLRVAGNAYGAARYLAPWMLRRARGVSSGDGISPKRPQPAPVELFD